MNLPITVGIDGSTGSVRALTWAAREANLRGCGLEVVHTLDDAVVNQPAVVDGLGRPVVDDRTDSALQKFSDDLVEAAERRANEVEPAVKVWGRSERGSPARVLIDASESASCIVVGRRGLGALRGSVGSVSTKVTTRAKCPVIVIPDNVPDSVLESSMQGSIVVGVDDSQFGIAALRFALEEASVRKVPVRVVSAYQPQYFTIPSDADLIDTPEHGSRDHAGKVLDKALAAVSDAEKANVEIELVVTGGPAADTILTVAADSALIVVGSHGRGLARRLILGSVSHRLLHDTDRPIAVINADV